MRCLKVRTCRSTLKVAVTSFTTLSNARTFEHHTTNKPALKRHITNQSPLSVKNTRNPPPPAECCSHGVVSLAIYPEPLDLPVFLTQNTSSEAHPENDATPAMSSTAEPPTSLNSPVETECDRMAITTVPPSTTPTSPLTDNEVDSITSSVTSITEQENPENPAMATLAQIQKLREDLRNLNTCIDKSAHELFGKIEEIFDSEKEKLKRAVERVDEQLAALGDTSGGPLRPKELEGGVSSSPPRKEARDTHTAELVGCLLTVHQREMGVLREKHCAEMDQVEEAYEAELERREQAFEAKFQNLAAAHERDIHRAVNNARIGMFPSCGRIVESDD
jgi:molecular chaperone GrpE (heat shock protein)